MKFDKLNKTYILAAIVIILLLVLVGVFVISRTSISGNPDEITIHKDDGTLVVKRNGEVTYTFGDSVYVDQWTADKTNTFFDYIYNNYTASQSIALEGFPDTITFTVNGEERSVPVGNDELVNIVIDETVDTGGGGGGSSDDGTGDDVEDIGDYFTSPTPASSPTSNQSPTPFPTPYDPHPGCLYWKLSYCAVTRPTAPPATPAPSGNFVIEADDCDDWNSQVDNNTIIDNTVCIPDQ